MLMTNEDNPQTMTMGGKHPILSELLIGSVSGNGIIEPQHKCMRETISLADSLGAASICHFQ
jgi:hypothetical protein